MRILIFGAGVIGSLYGVSDFVREFTLVSGGPYCDCGYRRKGAQ